MNKNYLSAIINKLTLVIILIIFSEIYYSQDLSAHIEKSVYNLSEKLILSQEQTQSIRNVLLDFFQVKLIGEQIDSSKIITEANNKIEAFLDRKQRIKFDVIKSDWWSKLLETKNSNVLKDSL